MPDAINLDDAVAMYLPASVTLPTGDAVSLKWHQHGELPKDISYPYGTFELLTSTPRGPSRKTTGQVNLVLVDQVDVIAYATGTLPYTLTQQDAASITSVTGTRSGIAHTFVATTDYVLTDRKTISWTVGGQKPDNATSFTVTYKHRMYQRKYGADGTTLCRLHVIAKTATIGARSYSKSGLADLVSMCVENYLRLNAGAALAKPPRSGPTPYHLEAAAGDFLSRSKEYEDPAETESSYSLDFQVKLSSILLSPKTQAILDRSIVGDSV